MPLSLEQQQLRPDRGLEEGGGPGGASQAKLGALRGSMGGSAAGWSTRDLFSAGGSGRKGSGAGGTGKEKLANRLRPRETLGVLMVSEREMADTDLLAYREDLENQDCLTHMDDLQVGGATILPSNHCSLSLSLSTSSVKLC